MFHTEAPEAETSKAQQRPDRPGLFNRPRQPPPASFRSFLQSLGGQGERKPRSFGGWQHPARCERAAADLLFLIVDESAPQEGHCVASQIREGASQFGYRVRVDRIETRKATGRDTFAIRELAGVAFGTAGSGRLAEG